MGDSTSALRRELKGYRKCIVWRLDKDDKFIEPLEGYIDYVRNVIDVYKDHRKVDSVALLSLVPLRYVRGLTDSQINALVHDGKIPS